MTRNQWLVIGGLGCATLAVFAFLCLLLFALIPTPIATPARTQNQPQPTEEPITASQPKPTQTPYRVQQPTETPRRIQQPTATQPSNSKLTLTNENWGLALSDTNSYQGVPVVLTGRIFLNPEISNDKVAFQIYTIKGATDGNTIVVINGQVKVKKDDYIRVEGKVYDQFEGQNAFGATLRVPRILATKVDIISREDAVAPALKKYTINQPISQYGLVITLTRVDLAKEETRFFVKEQNNSRPSPCTIQDTQNCPATCFQESKPKL